MEPPFWPTHTTLLVEPGFLLIGQFLKLFCLKLLYLNREADSAVCFFKVYFQVYLKKQ